MYPANFQAMNNKARFLKHQAQTTPYANGMEIGKAEGMYIYDTNGNAYMDLVAGVSACSIGHGHPKVIEAVQKQAATYMHVMVYGEYIQSPQLDLAMRYHEHLPDGLDCTYFVNSGVEAIEGAMKLAKRVTARADFISCKNSYHGSTHGALSLMGTETYKQKYRPLLPNCKHIEYNNPESLSAITKNTAAVIIEPVQGASGFITPKDSFLQKVRTRCNETGTLLIFDEIQTCYGRTGKMFGLETYGVVPDILCIAKGMGGGMPIGAFISSTENMALLKENPKLGHITTFGGHPVSCAAALTTFDCIKNENILEQIPHKEACFRKHLQHPSIQEIRGTGLMLAIELGSDELCQKVVDKCYEKSLITFFFLFTGSAIRLSPPLIISEEEIIIACAKIIEAIDEVK